MWAGWGGLLGLLCQEPGCGGCIVHFPCVLGHSVKTSLKDSDAALPSPSDGWDTSSHKWENKQINCLETTLQTSWYYHPGRDRRNRRTWGKHNIFKIAKDQVSKASGWKGPPKLASSTLLFKAGPTLAIDWVALGHEASVCLSLHC